jgi:hypothetical protein
LQWVLPSSCLGVDCGGDPPGESHCGGGRIGIGVLNLLGEPLFDRVCIGSDGFFAFAWWLGAAVEDVDLKLDGGCSASGFF